MADQDNSLREDLEAAIETVDDGAEETTTHEVEGAPAQEAEGQATETETEVPAEGGAEPAADDVVAQPDVVPPGSQPPVDWPDEVKEQWATLQPEVQNLIAERERHVNEVLQHSADARQAVDTFQQMIQPFTPLMQAEGVSDPLTAINGLLQTTAQLALGSPQQKAQKVAELIGHYGVDIATLDSLLAGEPVANPEDIKLQQMLDARLAPVNQMLSQFQQAQQRSAQQVEAENAQTIDQFARDPKNVHFMQVREVMADFLDIAATNGQEMSLEQAYQRACMAVPEVAAQVMQSQANGIAGQNQQALAGAQAAASSVTGQPGAVGTGGIEEGLSLRETLEQAAGLHGSGRI